MLHRKWIKFRQALLAFFLCLCLGLFPALELLASDLSHERGQPTEGQTEETSSSHETGGSQVPTKTTETVTEKETEASIPQAEKTTRSVSQSTGRESANPPASGDSFAGKKNFLKKFPYDTLTGFKLETYKEKPLTEIYADYADKIGAIYTGRKRTNKEPFYTLACSGFFISGDGYLLTTYGQIEDMFDGNGNLKRDLSVKLLTNFSKQLVDLSLYKIDPGSDLAIFKVDPVALGLRSVSFVELSTSYPIEIGEAIYGIGLSDFMAAEGGIFPGYIIEKGVTEVKESGYAVRRYKSSAIIPNNSSGSVIVNSAGQAIGISTVAELNTLSDRYSLILPADQIKFSLTSLFLDLDFNSYPSAGLTFMAEPDYRRIRSILSLPKGLYVTSVRADGPAYVADIRKDDVIIAVDGQPVESFADYYYSLTEKQPGSSLKIDLYRPGEAENYSKNLYLD